MRDVDGGRRIYEVDFFLFFFSFFLSRDWWGWEFEIFVGEVFWGWSKVILLYMYLCR